eukprot:Amastigsp_a339297_116.p4 type:complete len:187 gc:universal Amastigsp_a339297_116:1848-1288(-)
MSTLPVRSSNEVRVCLSHSSSLRLGMSSLACAPRDSLRLAAACMVWTAWLSRFCSSSASTRSEFQTIPRSLVLRSFIMVNTSSIFFTPATRVFSVRYTAACCCMHSCICARMWLVGTRPLAKRTASRFAIDASPAPAGSGLLGAPGLYVALMLSAHERPKTTRSRSELAPRRLAPWTEAHAASPAA